MDEGSDILRINGVELRRFRRSKTWNVVTEAKRRLKLRHQQQDPNPPINLDLKYGPQPRSNITPTYRYTKPKYFKTAADGTKTEVFPISNGLESFPSAGLAAAAAPGSFAEMRGEPIPWRRRRDDMGQSSESVVGNLNSAAESVLVGPLLKRPRLDLVESAETMVDPGTKAEVEGGKSSEN